MRLRPLKQQVYTVNLPQRETFVHKTISFITPKSSDLSVITFFSHLFVFGRLNKHFLFK